METSRTNGGKKKGKKRKRKKTNMEKSSQGSHNLKNKQKQIWRNGAALKIPLCIEMRLLKKPLFKT